MIIFPGIPPKRLPGPCDWMPEQGRIALGHEEGHAPAVFSVGKNPTYHLCAACADLPQFRRKGRMPLQLEMERANP